MPRSYDLLVFDWDGTLMDSEARIVACLSAAITDLVWEPRAAEQLRDIIGLGLREAAHRLYPELDDTRYAQFVERYRYHFLTGDPTPSELFPGAADTLRALEAQGYWLAVATGKGRQGLNQVLEETGLKSVFHTTRTADETASKPHPRMLLEIIEELEQPPERTLMIGDTEYDMQMAAQAGTHALAVSYGVHARERLLNHGPVACIERIDELISWLDRR